MSTPTITAQIRWQDLKVRGEIDIVFEIAKKEGWKDCEVFGYGDMITEPQEIIGWKLIPADAYEHSIPPEAIRRLHQIVNAGIRVQGVIIADDQRKDASPPTPVPVPVKPRFSLPSVKPLLSRIGNAAKGTIHSVGTGASLFGNALRGFAGTVVSFIGKALIGLVCVAGVVALVGFAGYLLIHHLWLIIPLGFLLLCSASSDPNPNRSLKYDPKLVALVDDGSGRTVWVSLFTWYD